MNQEKNCYMAQEGDRSCFGGDDFDISQEACQNNIVWQTAILLWPQPPPALLPRKAKPLLDLLVGVDNPIHAMIGEPKTALY